jgi:hypothetical protein
MTSFIGLNLQPALLKETHFAGFAKKGITVRDRVLYSIHQNINEWGMQSLKTNEIADRLKIFDVTSMRKALLIFFNAGDIFTKVEKNTQSGRLYYEFTFKPEEALRADLKKYKERIDLVENEENRIVLAKSKLQQVSIDDTPETTPAETEHLADLSKQAHYENWLQAKKRTLEHYEWNPSHPLGLLPREKRFIDELDQKQRTEPPIHLSNAEIANLGTKFGLSNDTAIPLFFRTFKALYEATDAKGLATLLSFTPKREVNVLGELERKRDEASNASKASVNQDDYLIQLFPKANFNILQLLKRLRPSCYDYEPDSAQASRLGLPRLKKTLLVGGELTPFYHWALTQAKPELGKPTPAHAATVAYWEKQFAERGVGVSNTVKPRDKAKQLNTLA